MLRRYSTDPLCGQRWSRVRWRTGLPTVAPYAPTLHPTPAIGPTIKTLLYNNQTFYSVTKTMILELRLKNLIIKALLNLKNNIFVN